MKSHSYFPSLFLFSCAILSDIALYQTYFGWGSYVAMAIISIVEFGYGIYYGICYVLTDEGIRHEFLGIYYHTTRWDEVQDAALITRLDLRFPSKFLLITVKDGKIYRPTNMDTGKISEKGCFMDCFFRRKHFKMRCDTEEFLAFFIQHYGPLDYDFFKEQEALKRQKH